MQLHSDSRSKHAAFVLAGPELYKFDMPHADIKASQVVFEESNSVSSRPADSSQSNSGSQFSQDGISNAIEVGCPNSHSTYPNDAILALRPSSCTSR